MRKITSILLVIVIIFINWNFIPVYNNIVQTHPGIAAISLILHILITYGSIISLIIILKAKS